VKPSKKPARKGKSRSWLRRILLAALLLVIVFYGFIAVSLLALRVINPRFTGVQIQRRVESWMAHTKYQKRYHFVSLREISRDLQHAVIAAEDSRFFQHHGFDWEEIQNAVNDDLEDVRSRGASTITQQLVKNLYFTTHRSFIRKGIEFTIVPLAERILTKQRILELYLNVIEWGPAGIYGAEAAAQFHYHVSAARVDRDEAARLAAILPSPRSRRPARMGEYSAIILSRMAKMGW
jgi:monofunctional biosynthetic peptidoglycan transglycosylase